MLRSDPEHFLDGKNVSPHTSIRHPVQGHGIHSYNNERGF